MGHAERKGALRALILAAPPSVVRKATTGVVSLFTDFLSIPPVLGMGTAVDLTILVVGSAVAVYRVVKDRSPELRASSR